MAQNSQRTIWPRLRADRRLREIMADIHRTCASAGLRDDDRIDYVLGANLAGFRAVADAMLDQGLI